MSNTTKHEELSAQDTGKAIRAALREAFPGTKFSVRMDRGTAWGSFSVSWTDGPVDAEVSEITSPFQGKQFDGMTDSESIVRGVITWKGKKYITGAGYVSTQQRISDERRDSVIAILRKAFPNAQDGALNSAAHQAGHCLRDGKISSADLFACARYHHGLGEPYIVADFYAIDGSETVENDPAELDAAAEVADGVISFEQAAARLGYARAAEPQPEDPQVARMIAAGWLS